jgi:toxin-antitoxin system PIN domain toxin
MILPDINLLVYAYNSDAPLHAAARRWWEDTLSETRSVALPWVVLLGYLRLMTSRHVLQDPFEPGEVLGHIRSWLERPHTQILHPGPRHLALLEGLIHEAGISGKLTTDIHLAALAMEFQAELHSRDTDFGRFSGLRWTDPLRP